MEMCPSPTWVRPTDASIIRTDAQKPARPAAHRMQQPPVEYEHQTSADDDDEYDHDHDGGRVRRVEGVCRSVITPGAHNYNASAKYIRK